MKTQTLLVFLALSVCMVMVTSQDFGEVYCGRRLATALALLCDNNLIKRADTHHSINEVDSSWPWLPQHSAHSMGRSKRQVVSECCDKPCTVDELLSYCG
ncbi:unnamed protein product, partial [Brenthis ino]